MADDGGEFDKDGTGRLQQGVQRGMRGTDVQLPLVDAIEERAFLDGVLHVINQRLDSWDGRKELGLEPLADLRLTRWGGCGGHDGAKLLVASSVEESIIVFNGVRYFPPVGYPTAYCRQ